MIDALGVLTWLNATCEQDTQRGPEPPRKRARLDLEKDGRNAEKPRHLPTPSVSASRSAGSSEKICTVIESLDARRNTAMSASPKRRRRRGDDDDAVGQPPDSTPRPRKRPPVLVDAMDSVSVGSSSRQSISSYASSGVSRNSSPRKQLRNAGLQSTGFRQASFAMDHGQLPASLRELCHDLERVDSGVAILPERLQSELAAFRVPAVAFEDNEETTYLRYPPLDFARRIFKRAVECDIDCEGESSWNVDVHGPLLDWVLRRDPNGLVLDFRCCTNAGLIHEYRPKDAPSKMVDFCLAIRPNEDEQRVIDHLCRTRPGLSINHTEWGNLTRHPIAISIETKHQGGDSAVALLQIATWHSAQWRSLRWGNLDKGNLEFLPGIIVQGHDWKFVATTLGEDLMATTFKSLQLGNTESIPGIYKLAVSLQRLKRWAEDRYWPAFKADILGL